MKAMESANATPGSIPPNHHDQQPLLLGDALAHVLCGRLFGAPRRPWSGAALGVTAAGILCLQPATLVTFLSSVLAALVTVTGAYMIRYAGFAKANRERGTLCPRCTSRMWQFCCARCREPVPPLGFLWHGAFLASCPHCGFALSSRRGTLMAWCSTCSHAEPRPHRFYAAPVHVVVMAVGQMPGVDDVRGGWQLVRTEPTRLTLHYPYDDHSAAVMVVVDYRNDSLRFDPLVISRTRLLLISDDVPEAYLDQLRALFSRALFDRTRAGSAVPAGARLAAPPKEDGS